MTFTPQEAHAIGTAAFKEGRSSAPATNPRFMERLAARVDPEFGSALPLLKAFTTAWHTAHAESTKDLLTAMDAIPTGHIEEQYEALDTPQSIEFLVELAELCIRHTRIGTPEAVALKAYAESMLTRLDHTVRVGDAR